MVPTTTVLVVDAAGKAGSTIVAALNDVLRGAREFEAGYARHKSPRAK
jgi:hypothetical protein